jgi:hypothetical protein
MPSYTKNNFSGHLHKNKKNLNFVFLLQVFFIFAIFVFRENRFFRNFGSFTKLRNSRKSSIIFAKYENRFVASFAKFSRNEISSKTLSPSQMRVKGTVSRDFSSSVFFHHTAPYGPLIN